MDVSAQLKPSVILQAVIAVILIVALVAICLTRLSATLSFALGFAALVSATHQWLWLSGKLPRSVQAIHYEGGQWSVALRDGAVETVQLTNTRVVLPFLISVSFTSARGIIPCVVFCDAVSVTEHRRLRSAVIQAPVVPSVIEHRLRVWREKCLVLAESWWHQNRIRWSGCLQRIIERVM